MYHRVAEPLHDPWGLAVSPARFASQLTHLARHRIPMRMDDFAAASRDGSLPRAAVAITFDDGYLDNFVHAAPRLVDRALPATLFVTTGRIGDERGYWWDELARLVLADPRPSDASATIGTVSLPLLWGADGVDPAWRADRPATTDRQRTYLATWSALRGLSEADRQVALQALRETLGAVDADDDRPMTASELARLAAGGAFELAAHSVHHPALTLLDSGERRWEMRESRRACEAIVGRPVHGFAYPYGDLDEAVCADVIASGFAWAFTTVGATVAADADRYRLPRIAVGDWDVERFAAALRSA